MVCIEARAKKAGVPTGALICNIIYISNKIIILKKRMKANSQRCVGWQVGCADSIKAQKMLNRAKGSNSVG